MRLRAALAVLGLTAASLTLVVPRGEAANPAEIVRTVTYEGRTLTVRLHPASVRAPGFEVLVQQADGGFVKAAVPPERSYLGSVDGLPSAVSSGIIDSEGKFDGQIVFDRGGLWQFKDSTVYATRGLTPAASYHWPSAEDTTRNVTVAPGQVGATTYRWDIGYDLANVWFTDPATINGSVAKAIDAVELATVSLLDVYATNAQLRPAVGRVIIRADAARDPYPAGSSYLGNAKEEWRLNQADAAVDDVALFHGTGAGGGVAYVGTAGTEWGVSANGGTGVPRAVLRHELGHTWGPHDNHTNGPEGATIESGNQFERFDGTELSAIMRYRDSRQAASAPFTVVSHLTEPVPPYAALDLVDRLTGGVAHSFRPTLNDHDANGDKITLSSVAATSHAGGKVSRSGNVVTYVPPAVSATTVDWVEYVVRDITGRTATGVSLFRVEPRTSLAVAARWPQVAVTVGSVVELVNSQSGLLAGVPVRWAKPGPTVQRARSADLTRVKIRASGAGYQLRDVGARGCFAAKATAGTTRHSYDVVVQRCRDVRAQRWRVVKHPRVGVTIMNAKTGRCLMPARASMTRGVTLVQAPCGFTHAQSWRFSKVAAG